jgi:proteasome alpha subunit
MPFYVAPEQLMKDKADFARKGIARGRSLLATVYDAGILICAENSSATLHKIGEIYDRIAFAGVGKYNEFDQLRQSGIRGADVKGFQFSREDVNAQSLASSYGQLINQVFTHDMKPLEVEILVAEVGSGGPDALYHILYDGTILDEAHSTVLGGDSEAIATRMEAAFTEGWDLGAALKAAVTALGGPERTIPPGDLEVAVLERAAERRAFRRLTDDEVSALLA